MDKQDELAAVIHEAHRTAPYPWWHTDADKCRMAQHIAAAVRSFMGSDEVVSRAEHAAARVVGVGVGSLDVPVVQMTRAALSAAIGEDIGGARGQ